MSKNCDYKLKTLKALAEEYYVVPKGITGTLPKIETMEQFNRQCAEFNIFEVGVNCTKVDKAIIVYSKSKKFNEEEVAKIKAESGSQRAKAKKYNVSVGTINKIMNDKY